MAEFPAMPLWTDAYLADTRHLTCEEHGAYLLLMMEAWRRPRCSLPDNDDLLARLACCSPDAWVRMKPSVMEFWELDSRRKEWTQKRLSKERGFVAQKSQSQREKATKRWKKKKKPDAAAMPDTMPEGMPKADPAYAPTPTTNKSSVSKDTSGGARANGSKPSKRKRETPVPKAWLESLPDVQRAYAEREGLSASQALREWKQFTNSAVAKGRTYKDWPAAWRTWVGNLEKFGGGARASPHETPGQTGRAAVMKLFEGVNDGQGERETGGGTGGDRVRQLPAK